MFRVRWERRALDELAAAWAQADSPLRKRITAAAHFLEQRLIQDPQAEGESRPGGRRITFEPPLALRFRVNSRDRSVSVLHIRIYLPRGH